MTELSIASINVKGLGNNRKRREVFNWLRNKRQSIYFLQEAHCTEQNVDLWRSEWGYEININNRQLTLLPEARDHGYMCPHA